MGAVVERELRARDRPDAERLQRVRHLHGAVEAVVVGEGQSAMALLGGSSSELNGM